MVVSKSTSRSNIGVRGVVSKVYSMSPSDARIVAQQLCNGFQHCSAKRRQMRTGERLSDAALRPSTNQHELLRHSRSISQEAIHPARRAARKAQVPSSGSFSLLVLGLEPCESSGPSSPFVPRTSAAVREPRGLASVEECASSPELVDDVDAAEVADPATVCGATVVMSTHCEPVVDPSTRMDASGSISTVPLMRGPSGFYVARCLAFFFFLGGGGEGGNLLKSPDFVSPHGERVLASSTKKACRRDSAEPHRG